MSYLGEDLTITQLLFALNTKLSEKVRPSDLNIPGAKLSVYKLQVKTALATINMGLNAYKPVARLPPDILLSIPTYFDSDAIQSDLVDLTHVSQYWREMFISASSLWSTIHIRALNTPLLVLSLQRSGSAPIKMHIGHKDYDRFAAVVAPIMAARQNGYDSLCLELGWDRVADLSKLTSNSVSHLRVLSLNVAAMDFYYPVPVHVPFPRALALQELTLRLVSVDVSTVLDCLKFTNLTVLSLFCTGSISQSKILEFLRASPRLKRVGLDFRRLTADQTSCPPVILRELRQLRVVATTPGDSHLQLFSNLICPIADDVIISVQPVYLDYLEASPFQSTWGFFPRSSKVHTVGLQVERSLIESIYSIGLLYGEASRFEISFRFVSFGPRGVPRIIPDHEFCVFSELLRALRALSLNGVTRFSITGIDPSTIPSLIKPKVFCSIRELFADMKSLEILTVSSGCLQVVCQTLTPRL